jgi:hypothetical protein
VGHRKNRKRERRHQLQGELQWRHAPQVSEEDFLKPDPFSLLEMAGLRDGSGFRTDQAKACGGCREFVEDHEGGRGTCLHPGSGVLNPWSDTAACDFFARGRAMNRR